MSGLARFSKVSEGVCLATLVPRRPPFGLMQQCRTATGNPSTVAMSEPLVAESRANSHLSGGRRGSHPPAPTDPGVTVSRYPALVILVIRQWGAC